MGLAETYFYDDNGNRLSATGFKPRLWASYSLITHGSWFLTQRDVWNVQLAKGAIRAGIDLICREIKIERFRKLLAAGTFGNDIPKRDAIAIGMFPDMPEEDGVSIGNAAGQGAILYLFNPKTMDTALRLVKNVSILEFVPNPQFQEAFIEYPVFSGLQ